MIKLDPYFDTMLIVKADLLSSLLFLLTLVALVAQLVAHLLAEFCFLLQPVSHCVSVILKLHLFL